ncbi:extracellular solute-binding protein [Bacteroides heparinolyticus]|uniref:extracellular solute-binding protein n=1 Tax=Prevotella heparinolytica TaxID=28113 RepID=UPI00359F6D17
MKKILMIISVLLVLGLSVFGIYQLLKPKNIVLACIEQEKALYTDLIALYEAENSALKVNLLVLQEEEYGQPELWKSKKIDVLALPGSFRIKDFSEKEIFSDLAKISKGEEYLLRAAEDEKIYALTLNGSIPLLLSDKQILEQQGLIAPSSFSEFRDVSLVLGAFGYMPFVLEQESEQILKVRALLDNVLLNGLEGRAALLDEQGELNPAVYSLETLAYISELSSAVKTEEISASGGLLSYGSAGSVPMLILGSADIGMQEIDKERYDLAVFPGSALSSFVGMESGQRIAIPKSSGNMEGAKRFAKFLLSSSAQKVLYEETGLIPAHRFVEVKGELQGVYEYLTKGDVLKVSFFEGLSSEEEQVLIREVSRMFLKSYTDGESLSGNIINALQDQVTVGVQQ